MHGLRAVLEFDPIIHPGSAKVNSLLGVSCLQGRGYRPASDRHNPMAASFVLLGA